MNKKITILVALFLVVIGLMPVAAQDDMAQTNKQKILDTYAAYNAGDHDALYNLVTDPFMMNQGDATLTETTQNDMVGYDQALFGAMPDIQQNADVVIAQGDWVAMHVTLTGTFTEPFSFAPFGPDSFPPNNAVITWTETDFVHFNADGLVDQMWGMGDPTSHFGQMGIFPSMGEDDMGMPLDSPAGYQTLSADELAATFTSGMEERNMALFQEMVDAGLGADTSAFYASPYISWNSGLAYAEEAGGEEDAAFFGMIASAMPDVVLETPLVVAEGDWVAVLVQISGTFTDDVVFFDGTPLTATGEPIVWQLGILDRFDAEGTIVEEFTDTNVMPLLGGLGLMPPMGGE